MGLKVELFIDPIDESLKCGLCNAVYQGPVVTSCCGFVYCVACLRDWIGKRDCCPQSCKQISFDEDVTCLLPLQDLVSRLRIRCVHYVKGCEAIHAVSGMLAHMEVCEYTREAPSTAMNYSDQRVESCEKAPEVSEFSQVLVCKKGCGLPLLSQDSSDHNCVKSLQAHVSSLLVKLTRTEHDKEKISQRLVKREECMQERFTQLEMELRQYQEQTLNYERVARNQRSYIKYLQRQLENRGGDQASQESEVKVVLERHGGILGLNIRGGTEEDDDHSGIYVSKIVENSPASQPGKLQLYDRILQINDVDLTNASHQEAVTAFKDAGDTINITVRRQFNPKTGSDMLASDATVVSIGVQTEVVMESSDTRPPLTCCRCGSNSNRSSQEFSSQGGINIIQQREDSGVDETGEHPSDVELMHNGCDSNELLDKRMSTNDYASPYTSGKDVILNELLLNTSLAALDKRNGRVLPRGDTRRTAYDGEDASELCSLSNGYYSGNVSQVSLENVKQGIAENGNVVPFDDANDAQKEMDENIDCPNADDFQDDSDPDQLYYDSELEYEYEHITIKMIGQRSLGMKLFAGDDEDVNSVFVNEVEPRSIVGKDGRVIEGDQILKVNGMAVTCITDAVNLLSERRDKIQFLVARPVAELQATLLGAESNNGESPSEQASRSHLEAYPIGVIEEEDEDEAETIIGDKCEKDSGFGRTDESLKNDESSEQDVGDDHRRKGTPKEQQMALGQQIMHLTACANNTREQVQRDSPRERSSDEHSSQRSSEKERREGKGSKHSSRRSSTKTSTDENVHSSGHERRAGSKSHKSHKSSKIAETSPAASSRTKEKSESREKDRGEHRRKKDRSKDAGDSSRLSRTPKDDRSTSQKPHDEQASSNENGEMKVEWRVRRNKDGSRIFISKKMRPAKQKLLRERAQKLAEERRGLTTDDETQSVYLGRYWSQEDRRKQLVKVREARRAKKVEVEMEKANGSNQKRNDLAIIQLTQKKIVDQTFDDFVTVEEILRQRNRLGFSSGPIFVTTV